MTGTTPTTGTAAPLTPRECVDRAAAVLHQATNLADLNPAGAASLATVADTWRVLGESIARTPSMAPPRTDDDN